MVKRKKLSPVTVMMKNINIYLYEHKQSLELKHLSCCSVELRTWKLVNTHHGYPPASNQNETKGKCVCPREELWGFIWAASLRCHHIYRAAAFFSLFFFYPTRSGQTNGGRYILEWDGRVQWWEQGVADWYLHINPGQTWGHFPAFLICLFVSILLWSLRFTL